MSKPTIAIAILANAKQAKKELGGFQSTLSKTFDGVKKLGIAGGAALGAFALSAVKSASDAQQSLGATETVFGKYANNVVKTSNKAARAVGLSANEYRELANQTGAIFSNQGVAAKDLAGSVDGLVKTGADLAATFGGSTRESVEALTSAFKGEFDPLEKYGISLKQSTVNAEAAGLAQKKYGQDLKSLSGDQQTAIKQQATQNLITKQAAKTNGAFAKETNTLAHQQQVLGAQFDNIKAKVGTALLPILTKFLSWVTGTAVPKIQEFASKLKDDLAPAADKIKEKFNELKEKLEPVGQWFKDHPEVIKGVAIGLGLVAVAVGAVALAMGVLAIASSPITLIVLAVAALAGAIAYLWKNNETFKSSVQAVGNFLKSTFKPVWDQLVTTFKGSVLPALVAIKNKFIEWWPVISKVLGFVGKLYVGWLKFQAVIVAKVITVIAKVIGFFARMVPPILNVISAVARFIGKVAGMAGSVGSAIGKVVSWFKSLPGKIKGAFGNAATFLTTVGSNIVAGLKSGISGAWDSLVGWVKGKVDALKSAITNPLEIFSPSRWAKRIGGYLTQGLRNGIVKGFPETKKAVVNLAKIINETLPKSIKKPKAIKKWREEHAKEIKKATKETLKALRTDAVARLNALKQQRADYAASIKENAISFAALSNFSVEDGKTMDANGIQQYLSNRLSSIKTFTSKLAALAKKGLSKDLYNQIVQMGPEQGMAYADALTSATPAQLSAINSTQNQIVGASTALGTATSNSMYKSGVDAAQGFVNGLNKMLKKVAGMGTKISKSLVKALKKALGIKSPSRVMGTQANYTVDGLVNQINRRSRDVAKAGSRMGTALAKGFGDPSLSASAAFDGKASSAGGNVYNINVSVPVTANPVETGREIIKAIEAYERVGRRRVA